MLGRTHRTTKYNLHFKLLLWIWMFFVHFWMAIGSCKMQEKKNSNAKRRTSPEPLLICLWFDECYDRYPHLYCTYWNVCVCVRVFARRVSTIKTESPLSLFVSFGGELSLCCFSAQKIAEFFYIYKIIHVDRRAAFYLLLLLFGWFFFSDSSALHNCILSITSVRMASLRYEYSNVVLIQWYVLLRISDFPNSLQSECVRLCTASTPTTNNNEYESNFILFAAHRSFLNSTSYEI